MEDLIDIQGLDAITWWPLALGWWIVLTAVVSLLVAGTVYLWRRHKYRKSWQYLASNKLKEIRAQMHTVTPKETVQSLSVEMRKIAMLTANRDTCASLVGKQWLEWLEKNDPYGFNWTRHGTLLIDAQYKPELNIDDLEQINTMLNASLGWVRKC